MLLSRACEGVGGCSMTLRGVRNSGIEDLGWGGGGEAFCLFLGRNASEGVWAKYLK